ncbi:MAG: DUF4412 domain-containing protein [Pseudomonadota bacterium]
MALKHTLKAAAVAALAVGCTASAWAGSIIRMESRDHAAGAVTVGNVNLSVDGESLRMDMEGMEEGDQGSMVFKSDLNEMMAIDHARKEFYIIDEATMQGMANQMGSAMQQMQAALADLPPEQRAMAEQMMQQRFGAMGAGAPEEPQTSVSRTGGSDTVNGFDCEVFEVSQDGRRISELCVADWGDIEGGSDVADSMQNMARFFENLRDMFAQAGAGFMDMSGDMFAHMQEMDGFPVRTRSYDDTGSLENETVILSSEESTLDAAVFAAPEGYRQQTMGN